MRNRGLRLFALSALTLALALSAALAYAQRDRGSRDHRKPDRCYAQGPRPYVCSVVLEVSRPGGRGSESVDPNDTVRISPGGRLDIELVGIDQNGQEFPAERVRWTFDPNRSCSGLIDVDQRNREHFQVEAKERRGTCEVLLQVPGNLNLEWQVRFEVGRNAHEGSDRNYAQVVAQRLYRGILGREADAPGLAGAIAEIQRDRLEEQVDAMLRSEEFLRQRAQLGANVLLRSFYNGLLDREPDSAGVRTYLSDLERRHYRPVILAIVTSEEFEAQVVREVQGRR